MQNEFRFPNIATPPGSSAYYLVRFSPRELRDRHATLFAWRRELQRLLDNSDPGVARLKLDYWRKQLEPEQLFHSRHPLTQMIQRHLPQETAELNELADLTEREILTGSSNDWNQVLERCGAIGGTFSALLTSAFTDDDRHLDQVRTIGQIDEVTRQLQRIGQKEYLQRFPSVDDKGTHIAEWIADLQQRAENTSDLSPPGPAKAQLALARALLDIFSRDPALLLDATVDLTPIRKLWIVWRNRSQMRQ